MFAAESNKVVGLPAVAESTTGYWTLWTARVLWLLTLLAAVWHATEGEVPLAVWAAACAGLVMQFGFFCSAAIKQLPQWHTWVTTATSMLIVAVTWSLVPTAESPLLLLAPIVLVDAARSYGWNSVLLLVIFPFAPMVFTSLIQSGRIVLDPQIWGVWVASALVAITLVRPHEREVSQPLATRGELLQDLLASAIRSFAAAPEREQVFAVLMRGGVDTLDYGRKRAGSRALVLTFREGLRDLLQIAAVHNLEPALLGAVYEPNGTLSKLAQEGAAFDVDGGDPPFDSVRSLRGHRLLIIPLRAGVDLYGAVVFATKDDLRAGDLEVQNCLQALAAQASLVLQNRVLTYQLQGGRRRRMQDEGELRHQLARDLHDGPVQRVAALSMQLEFIKVLFTRDPKRAADELERAQHVAKLAAQEMRTMLFALRPVVLEASGLRAGLEALVKRLQEEEHVPIDMVSDPLPRLEAPVEETAFAILQEAISNARKHSKGARIHVRLVRGEALIVGQVEDQGPGFDLQAIMSTYTSKTSLGLINMHERAGLVGGQLKINTAPGKGVIVSLAIPVSTEVNS